MEKKQLKEKVMCFNKNTTEQPPFTDRTVAAVVVGDFPGTINDLAGPTEDAKDFRDKVGGLWPDMTFREFTNRQATTRRFISEATEASKHVGEDGMLFFIMDICHAESATRNGGAKRKTKFRGLLRGVGFDKVLVFSSSQSNQTSADAEFSNGANGAWHFALINTLQKGITYLTWFNRAKALLKQMGFSQTPVIEGPMELQNRVVFEGNVQTIEVSTHGGQVKDQDGDEADGLDEVIYFYDGMIRDDVIRLLIEDAQKRIFAKNKLKHRTMKVKNFRGKRDWKDSWLQTAVSMVGLLFVILVSLGVITPEQSAEAQPIISSTLGAISTIITGVVAIIGIFFKQDAPVE